MKRYLAPALGAFAILATGIGGAYAARPSNPSGLTSPIVNADDVLGVQCVPRTVTASTTLVKADNHCGVTATARVSAGSTLAVTTGTFAAVRVAHVKRWVGPLQTPAVLN